MCARHMVIDLGGAATRELSPMNEATHLQEGDRLWEIERARNCGLTTDILYEAEPAGRAAYDREAVVIQSAGSKSGCRAVKGQ